MKGRIFWPLVCASLLILLAGAILVTNRGPVFSWQQRIGLLTVGIKMSDATHAVLLQTRDGNSLQGTVELRELKIATENGQSSILAEQIKSIRPQKSAPAKPADRTMLIILTNGAVITGVLPVNVWKIRTQLGELAIQMADIKELTFTQTKPESAPKPIEQSSQSPVPSPNPSLKAADLPPDSELQLIQSLPLETKNIAFIGGAGEPLLYVVHSREKQLLAISTKTLTIQRQYPLGVDPDALSLTTDRKVAVFVSEKKITLLELDSSNVRKSFMVDADLNRIQPLDDQILLATTLPYYADPGNLLVISVEKQGTISTLGGAGGSIQLAFNRRKLYCSRGTFIFPPIQQLPREVKLREYPEGGGSGADFMLTLDDRFLIRTDGRIFRLGQTYVADVLPIGTIDPHGVCIFLPKASRLLAFTKDGFLKEYDATTFEFIRSTFTGLRVCGAFADESAGALYVLGCHLVKNPSESRFERGQNVEGVAPSDLYKLRLPTVETKQPK